MALSVWKYHREKIESRETVDIPSEEEDVTQPTPSECNSSESGSPVATTAESQSPIPDLSSFQTTTTVPSESKPQSPIPTDPSPLHSSEAHRPTFRVTCTRAGRKHGFSSMQAAGSLGASLMRHHQWKVQMKDADLDVLLHIMADSALVGLALSTKSQHRRNIVHFGPTTLRSTIAYGMLR